MVIITEDKMSATKTIIITAPNFITTEPTFELALDSKSQFHSETGKTKTLKRPSFQCVSTMERIPCINVEPVPSRKRRLDHLSLEEKLQRKKLKNRIAAQSSRDRKKAKMDELEFEVQDLKDKVSSLTSCCERLRDEVARLSEENRSLRTQMMATAQPQQLQPPVVEPCQTRRVGCAPAAVTGPAASSRAPLPQGRGAQPARGLAWEQHRRRRLLAVATTLLAALATAMVLPPTTPPPPPLSCPSTSWTAWTTNSCSRNSTNWPAASSRKQRPKPRTKHLQLQLLHLPPALFLLLPRFVGEAEITAMLKWWSRHRKKRNLLAIT